MSDLGVFLGAFFFALGAVIGSFLNVCILRLPQGKSIVVPGSHCMACGKPVRWFDNIPIFSCLFLGARCRDCGARFSFRYAGVEFLTGVLFFGFYLYFGLAWALIPWLFLVCLLLIATFVDFDLRIIPDELSIVGVPAGMLLSMLLPEIQLVLKDPALETGWFVCAALAGLCLVLVVIEALRRRSGFPKEDVRLLMIVFVVILLQYLAGLVSWPRAWGLPVFGLMASLQGVIVGGGALYLLGLAGSMLIKKRVVTLIDLKTVTDRPEFLFQELIKRKYLDEAGEIQSGFSDVKSLEGFSLDASWAKERESLYALIQDCRDGGVMGGGDVKLMALIGAFVGWKLALVTIVLAPFLGIPFAIIEKIRTKSSAIAFGPYLAMAAVLSLLFGERLIAWVLSGYGMY